MPYLNTKQGRCHFPYRAEGRGLGRDDALVDADDAVFEGLRDAPDTAKIAAAEKGGGPLPNPPPRAGEGRVGGVVGHLNRFVLGLEAVERQRGGS
jgi:hypothetical protein